MRIKAWAVLVPQTSDDQPGQLIPYGNGEQWQYPIFFNRREARAWRNKEPWARGSVVQVEIQVKRGTRDAATRGAAQIQGSSNSVCNNKHY